MRTAARTSWARELLVSWQRREALGEVPIPVRATRRKEHCLSEYGAKVSNYPASQNAWDQGKLSDNRLETMRSTCILTLLSLPVFSIIEGWRVAAELVGH